MKATAQTESFLNQSNQRPLCENNYSVFSFLWFWLLERGRSIRVRTNQLIRHWTALVVKGQAVGRVVQLLLSQSHLSRRIFVGLGLMGVVAPVSACVYMLFDRGDFVQGWYHVNYFHLFLVLAPSLFILSCLIGAWFLFPQGNKRAYALVVPAGFTVGKILWLIQCTSNTDFYSVVPSSFVFIGALISLFLFVALDWLAHSKFHREDAYEARLSKLMDMADDFDDAKFKSMIKTVWREKKAFKKQF